MSRLSEDFKDLNWEQRTLFIASFIFPFFIFGAIFVHFSNEVYEALSFYLFPPNFSICGFRRDPFYLMGYVNLCAILLSISSMLILSRKLLISSLPVIITLLVVALKLRYDYAYFIDAYDDPALEQFIYFTVENLLFFGLVSAILVWQISIQFRFLILNTKIQLK